MRAAEDSMQWRCVDDEHDKCPTRNDPNEVVLVTNYVFPERETVFSLHREYLRKVMRERRKGGTKEKLLLTLKHCIKNIDKYTVH